jgi:hypothetical protein
MAVKKRTNDTQKEQSARFREAAKKAETGDAKEFERAFKKVVSAKPSGRRSRPSGKLSSS